MSPRPRRHRARRPIPSETRAFLHDSRSPRVAPPRTRWDYAASAPTPGAPSSGASTSRAHLFLHAARCRASSPARWSTLGGRAGRRAPQSWRPAGRGRGISRTRRAARLARASGAAPKRRSPTPLAASAFTGVAFGAGERGSSTHSGRDARRGGQPGGIGGTTGRSSRRASSSPARGSSTNTRDPGRVQGPVERLGRIQGPLLALTSVSVARLMPCAVVLAQAGADRLGRGNARPVRRATLRTAPGSSQVVKVCAHLA